MRDFAIFGFSQEPEDLLKRRLSQRLGIVPRTIDFGNVGQFFFYTSYGDVAETEQAIALKLGFVRSPTKSPLSARQLLDQKIATPQSIDHAAVRGNALIACFSKIEAKFVAFKNVLSLPQLYYWASGDELIGSDSLRCLVAVLDRVELNQDILPYHFMFRHAPGAMTYFHNVHRLCPGQHFEWQEGNLNIHSVQDLRFPDTARTFERVDAHSIAALYQELKDVIGAYVSDTQKSGYGLGNLLSGGVDSSILQLILNEQLWATPLRSFSYAPTKAPTFEFEREYARRASAIFKTEHTFIEFTPEDYASLVVRCIEALGQPVISDVEPCKLAVAEFLAEHVDDLRFFFTALAADSLFGLGRARDLEVLDLIRKVPGSRLALAASGRLLRPFTKKSGMLLKGAEIIAHSKDPHLFIAPTNTAGVYCNLDIARRSFGDEAIRQVLEYRRNLEAHYLNSANYTEKVHIIGLVSSAYEEQVQSGQLFLVNGKEQIYPFMDDDIIRISLAFRPEIRYLKGLRTKPLLKGILEQHGLSAIARQPKGGSVFTDDLYAWMRSGPLRGMIEDIALPNYINRVDFEHLLQEPTHTLWSILTLDVFQKSVLSSKPPHS